jgi:hypothetical protein
MKKIILGLILAGLLGGVLIFFVKPEWAFDATPFLWSGYHKKAITDRTQTLVEHLCRNDADGCLPLTDPAYVRTIGEGLTKARFGGLILGLTLIHAKPEDVRIDEIALDANSKAAQVKVSLRNGSKWEPHKTAYRWIRVDGNWYITF